MIGAIWSNVYPQNVRLDSRLILSFSWLFHIPCHKRATLLHSPRTREGPPTKAQPCLPLTSTMHGQPLGTPSSTETKARGCNYTYCFRRMLNHHWSYIMDEWLHATDICGCNIMTSPNGNIFRVTGPLYGEFTSHGWIPRTKASDAELLCFLWSASEQTVE